MNERVRAASIDPTLPPRHKLHMHQVAAALKVSLSAGLQPLYAASFIRCTAAAWVHTCFNPDLMHGLEYGGEYAAADSGQ